MIQIYDEPANVMFTDAISAFPDECCGFMFGSENDAGDRMVTHATPVQNGSNEDRRRRFAISASDYIKAEGFAFDNGLQLLGVYHSHPNHPAVPSEHDRLAAQPWFSYLILSVNAEGVQLGRSWVLNDESTFDEEQVEMKYGLVTTDQTNNNK